MTNYLYLKYNNDLIIIVRIDCFYFYYYFLDLFVYFSPPSTCSHLLPFDQVPSLGELDNIYLLYRLPRHHRPCFFNAEVDQVQFPSSRLDDVGFQPLVLFNLEDPSVDLLEFGEDELNHCAPPRGRGTVPHRQFVFSDRPHHFLRIVDGCIVLNDNGVGPPSWTFFIQSVGEVLQEDCVRFSCVAALHQAVENLARSEGRRKHRDIRMGLLHH